MQSHSRTLPRWSVRLAVIGGVVAFALALASFDRLPASPLVAASRAGAQPATGFEEIEVGLNHTCAILTGGRLQCWGLNSTGQLGTGDFMNSSRPKGVAVLGLGGTAAVSAGGGHTCALAQGLRCWGDNRWGQIGNGNFGVGATEPLPVQIASGSGLTFTQVSAGHDHTCALTTDTEVWCWGLNNYGQVGNNTSGNAWLGPVPVCASGTGFNCTGGQRLTGVLKVEAGGLHTCAIVDTGSLFSGSLKCWGMNYNGQLGIGPRQNPTSIPTTAECTTGTSDGCRALPTDVIGLPGEVVDVAVGGAETCVIDVLQDVYCWGYNAWGQVGDGTFETASPYAVYSPTFVDEFLDDVIEQLTTGDTACGLDGLAHVWCWGLNSQGAVGTGETTSREPTPRQVINLPSDVVDIGGGGTHNCAVLDTGGAKCWGYNFYGQLGNGQTTPQFVGEHTPVDVISGDASVIEIAFRRCPEVGEAGCPVDAPEGEFISTDDAAVAVLSLETQLHDVFDVDLTRPAVYPHDGSTTEFPACTISVLSQDGVATALSDCGIVGDDQGVQEVATFPGGCPCAFEVVVSLPVSGENLLVGGAPAEPLGATYAGPWQIRVEELGGTIATASFNIQRVPAVLLVHGYGSSCEEGMFAVEPWLEQHLVDYGLFPGAEGDVSDRVECFSPGGPKPPPNNHGYDWTQGTYIIGAQIEDWVEDPADGFLKRAGPVPNDKIEMVGHSYGGINARWYIEKRGGSQYVNSLMMLGTPNLGTAAADGAMIGDLAACLVPSAIILGTCPADLADGTWQDDLGARDMSILSPVLPALNNGWVSPGTTYRVAAGDVAPGDNNPWSTFWSVFFRQPNDCLVTVQSAMGPFDAAVTRVWPRTSHKSNCTLIPNVNNDPAAGGDCDADAAHVFCDMNAFFGIPLGASSAGGGPAAAPQVAPSRAMLAPPGATPDPAGAFTDMLGGTPAIHTFDVDAAATSVTFALSWPDEDATPDLQLTVRRPDNSIAQAGDPGVTHGDPLPAMGGDLMETLAVAAPVAGTWTIEVSGTPGRPYVAAVTLESPITFDGGVTPLVVGEGAVVTLVGQLDENGAGLTGASVIAEVFEEGTLVSTVPLNDDGNGGYSATFAPAACGIYLVMLSASGAATSGPYERETFELLTVCQDADGDGCSDEAEQGVNVQLGGGRDMTEYWDYFDVPVPALTNADASGVKNKVVSIADILAILVYSGTSEGAPANVNGVDYDSDLNGNGRPDGSEYDRGPSSDVAQPWRSTEPNGVVSLQDAIVAIAQAGANCA